MVRILLGRGKDTSIQLWVQRFELTSYCLDSHETRKDTTSKQATMSTSSGHSTKTAPRRVFVGSPPVSSQEARDDDTHQASEGASPFPN